MSDQYQQNKFWFYLMPNLDQLIYMTYLELSPRVFFLSPKVLIDKIKASVPVAQPTEYFTLANFENFFSNFSTFFLV